MPTARHTLGGVGLVAVWITVPFLTALWLVPGVRDFGSAAAVADLVGYPTLLMAALLYYVRTRLARDERAAWVTVASVFVASQAVAGSVLRLAVPVELRDRPGWLMLVEVLVAATLVALVAASARHRVRGDPLVVGLLLGLAVTAVRLGLVAEAAPSPELLVLRPFLVVLVLALYLGCAVSVVRRSSLRYAGSLAATAGLIGISRVLTFPTPPDDVRSLVAVVADLLAGVIFCTAVWRLLVETLRETSRQQETLHDRLELAEAAAREERSVLHDVASAVAGITSASHLLTADDDLEPVHRERLLRMLAAESARLGRLASGSSAAPAEVDLDAALEPVLVSHAARGLIIDWRPTGHRAVGSADAVAEIVGILLDNTLAHSGATTARVQVRPMSDAELDAVDVTVSDDGRGIPDHLATRVFDWGARGPASAGQGIGLHAARELAEQHGGRLILGRAGRGTSVTLRLPPAVSVPALGGLHGIHA